MPEFRKGSVVKWKWGAHSAHGKIVETFTEDVTRRVKGVSVTRKATKVEPSYLIEQEDGGEVLKSASELSHHG